MTTKKTPVKVKPLLWDYVIDLIFKEYWSKDFYKKFKDWGKKFTPDITEEWQTIYMNWVWLVPHQEFFDKLATWKDKFLKEYGNWNPFLYEVVIWHILPVCAPKFIEQDSTTETNAETKWL